MEYWEISANTAEQIYEKREQLKDLKNYLIKLDVQRDFADKGSQRFLELDSRYNEMKQKYEDLESEIDQMESKRESLLREYPEYFR